MSNNPTKKELVAEIQVILKDANLAETAAKKVRLQLEKNLKCDLSNRKKEIDGLVMDYVNSQDSSEEEEDEESDGDAGNGQGKRKGARPVKENSDDEGDEEEEEEEDDDDDDYSEEEKPKGRKTAAKRATPAKRVSTAKKQKRTSDSEDESEGSDDDDKAGSDDEDYTPQKGAKGAKRGKPAANKRKNNSDSDSDEDWKKSKPTKAKKAGGGSKGINKPYELSPELAALCGAEALPRHEVVKRIWALIKERNLYDPKNKQYAICDADLHKVIGVKRFRTFGMLKYLKQHFKN